MADEVLRLKAHLSSIGNLTAVLTPEKTLRAKLSIERIVQGETYEGPYEVIPKAYEDQVLPTDNKLMINDVIVFEIPYAEVSNPAGGKTATIGGIINA